MSKKEGLEKEKFDTLFNSKVLSLYKKLNTETSKSELYSCYFEYEEILKMFDSVHYGGFNIESWKIEGKIEREPGGAKRNMKDDLKDMFSRHFKSSISSKLID